MSFFLHGIPPDDVRILDDRVIERSGDFRDDAPHPTRSAGHLPQGERLLGARFIAFLLQVDSAARRGRRMAETPAGDPVQRSGRTDEVVPPHLSSELIPAQPTEFNVDADAPWGVPTGLTTGDPFQSGKSYRDPLRI